MLSQAPRSPRPIAAGRPIRLLIVDDSAVARAVYAGMLQPPEFDVAAVAGTAEKALALLAAIRVDAILLDVQMPGMDGLSALPALIERAHGAHILVVSSACGEGAEASVRALALGAADTLAKPSASMSSRQFAAILTERLRDLGHVAASEPELPEAGVRRTLSSVPSLRMIHEGPIDCLAIGASTGGVNALLTFFAALPGRFDAPILITQHLPAAFMTVFAAQLAEMAKRPAMVGADGMRLRRGTIIVAPGDAHLALVRIGDHVRVVLQRGPVRSRCLPSVDPMLTAVGEVFGPAGVGVMLSGMGRDGEMGAAALVAHGGEMLVQDRSSAVVWGMPGVVAMAGLASSVTSPSMIARRVAMRAETAR